MQATDNNHTSYLTEKKTQKGSLFPQLPIRQMHELALQ